MRHICLSLLVLSLLFSLAACGSPPVSRSGSASAESAVSVPAASASSSAPAESDAPLTNAQRAAALMDGWTLEEKVGQLFFVRCPESGAAQDVAAFHLGGVLLFGRDFRDLTANEIIQTLNAYQEAARSDTAVPLLLGTDEEGGVVVRLSSNPAICKSPFRSPQRLLSDGGMEEIVRETHEKDVLLKALGLNVNFAPVADVSTDPSDFIYPRTIGQDAAGTSSYVSSVVETMSGDGMGSVLKHFPGYGNNADTHTGSAVDSRPLTTFESSDFLPFSAGFEAGGGTGRTAVLVCHNVVQSMDSDLPASLSPRVHALLRDQLGFDGVVMTDDLAMDAVKAYDKGGAAAVLALQAGNDMVLTTDYQTQIPAVIGAVQGGTLSESMIDTACVRVLCWKMALGLL